jgi:CheY-like chemotaxis protein
MSGIPTTILIVEDDTFKYDRIISCLKNLSEKPSIKVARSVQAAVALISKAKFDFILLDMSLPSHDLLPGGGAGSSLLSGGIEVIMELSFLNRADCVIVITQYPEVEIEGELVSIANAHSTFRKLFPANIESVILYRHESNEWEQELLKNLE